MKALNGIVFLATKDIIKMISEYKNNESYYFLSF